MATRSPEILHIKNTQLGLKHTSRASLDQSQIGNIGRARIVSENPGGIRGPGFQINKNAPIKKILVNLKVSCPRQISKKPGAHFTGTKHSITKWKPTVFRF